MTGGMRWWTKACTLDADLLEALRVFREGQHDRGEKTRWTLAQDACLLQE